MIFGFKVVKREKRPDRRTASGLVLQMSQNDNLRVTTVIFEYRPQFLAVKYFILFHYTTDVVGLGPVYETIRQ